MKFKINQPFTGILLLLASSFLSKAATIANVSFAFAGFGSPTYTGADLSTATSVTLAPLTVVSDVPEFLYGTTENDLFTSGTVSSGSSVMFTPLTLNLSGPIAVPVFSFLTFGVNNRYTFDVSRALISSNGIGTLNLDFFGTFHDSTGAFLQNVGETHIGLTQTGYGAISESGSFASRSLATNSVPEPGTLALTGALFSWAAVTLCHRSRLNRIARR